ncbi:MAG: murein biosynthesis integral membrane protein MurJ, partial [Prochlorotrichaceae cyanobacterium]
MIATIVAAATLISKLFGLVRQQAIAAAFGTGAAFDAYNYAYVIPGFLLILLGGINGPFHSAIVSVLAKQEHKNAAALVETITTLVGVALLILTVGMIGFADPLINLVAPGLSQTPDGEFIHGIAVQQLQIMAPMAVLAGFIGIGFGTLNAADQYWLPSISPLFSSATVILGIGGLWLVLGDKIVVSEYAVLGGAVLAGSTLAGAILQWLVQLPPQWKAGYGGLRLRFDPRRSGVKEVFQVLGPATFSSGMLQINVYTDLFFASYIPQAAAALGYAGLLAMTPLGILSNMILVPLMPVFSRLAEPENWDELKQRMRQGLLVTGLTMLPIGCLFVVLAKPIVQLVYERGAFQRESSEIVASLVVAYGVGMFVYLGRDVLVRVFYALGDGNTPFRVSIFNILLNAALDYLCVRVFDGGAAGLVYATVGVNLFSLILFVIILDRRLNGLPIVNWAIDLAKLTIVSVMAGGLAWGVSRVIIANLGQENLLTLSINLGLSGLVGTVSFIALALCLKIPEVDTFFQQLRERLSDRFKRS